MTNQDVAFSGMNPAIYDRQLGPMFFEPYARDLVRRLTVGASAAVLEIAAGTGIVTEHLRETLPTGVRLVVTDLNEAMLDLARQKIGPDSRIEWQKADACALPFADGSFDAVVCQFGLMFFPDKPAALRETHRVLKSSGMLLLNVWGSLADNPIASVAHEVAASFFPTDPPKFYTIPFGLHDEALLTRMMSEAGFSNVSCETVDFIGESESPESAAKGLVLGTPLVTAIQERGTINPTVIVHAVAARLTTEGGAAPMRLPMRALVLTGVRD